MLVVWVDTPLFNPFPFDNGFWIHFKRLEKGKVIWPDIYNDEITMNLSLEDFYNLIKSPGIKQKIKRDEVWKNH